MRFDECREWNVLGTQPHACMHTYKHRVVGLACPEPESASCNDVFFSTYVCMCALSIACVACSFGSDHIASVHACAYAYACVYGCALATMLEPLTHRQFVDFEFVSVCLTFSFSKPVT